MHAFHALHSEDPIGTSYAGPAGEQIPFLSDSAVLETPVRTSRGAFSPSSTSNTSLRTPGPPDAPRKSRKRKHDENEPPHELYTAPYPDPSPIPSRSAYAQFYPAVYAPVSFLLPTHGPDDTVLPVPPTNTASTEPSRPHKRKYHREAEKVGMLLRFLRKELGWTLGELLRALFYFGDHVHREDNHAAAVSSFLQGRMRTTPADIIHLWIRHPDGRLGESHAEYPQLFSSHPDATVNASNVRVALTCRQRRRPSAEENI